jgi:hypothetical protein
MIGLNGVTPTIPSKKKIHVEGLKISIHSYEENKSATKGQLHERT